MSNSLRPQGLTSPWNSSGQNTGVGSHFLLQGSSQPRDPTQISCLADRFFTSWATGEAYGSQSSLHSSDPTCWSFVDIIVQSLSCPALCNPMNCSMPGFPVLHHLPEFAQTHVYWVGDATQPSYPLTLPFFQHSVFPSIRVFPNESALHIRWLNGCLAPSTSVSLDADVGGRPWGTNQMAPAICISGSAWLPGAEGK